MEATLSDIQKKEPDFCFLDHLGFDEIKADDDEGKKDSSSGENSVKLTLRREDDVEGEEEAVGPFSSSSDHRQKKKIDAGIEEDIFVIYFFPPPIEQEARSFVFENVISNPLTQGLYALFFFNCLPNSQASFDLEQIQFNQYPATGRLTVANSSSSSSTPEDLLFTRNYLTRGEQPLPIVDAVFSALYFLGFLLWSAALVFAGFCCSAARAGKEIRFLRTRTGLRSGGGAGGEAEASAGARASKKFLGRVGRARSSSGGRRQQQQQQRSVFAIHYFMAAIVLAKSLAVATQALRLYFLQLDGYSSWTWAAAYYLATVLFTTCSFALLVLLGSGWSLLKSHLTFGQSAALFFVLLLQILANVSRVIFETAKQGSILVRNYILSYI